MSHVPNPAPSRDPGTEGGAEEATRRQLQLFVDAVAHDLRAPLRSIQNFSRLLEDRAAGQLDDPSRDHLRRIRRAADRMDGLLRGLGELSQASTSEFRSGPVDLGLLCEWVLAELQDTSPGREARVDTSGLADLRVEGDERLLRLALVRILDNAWRFTPADEAVRLEVRGSRGDGWVRLSVRDQGSGFDMRYAHKIFEPFQRLHGPEEGAGHGLGLAVAQRVAARHGGRIRAESNGEGGATFELELPTAGAESGTSR